MHSSYPKKCPRLSWEGMSSGAGRDSSLLRERLCQACLAGGDAKMGVLVEKLWSLQVLGSVTGLGRPALRRWREGRSCCCADILVVPLESPMLWDGWRWDHTIKSSLMQCSPAAGGLCAACLKQLIALPKTRRVL